MQPMMRKPSTPDTAPIPTSWESVRSSLPCGSGTRTVFSAELGLVVVPDGMLVKVGTMDLDEDGVWVASSVDIASAVVALLSERFGFVTRTEIAVDGATQTG